MRRRRWNAAWNCRSRRQCPQSLRSSRRCYRFCCAIVVDNAVRYAAGVGREIRIEVVDGDHPVCRIVDDGPGIPPEERARLGERFHRREGTGEEGSGLGLSIVQRIADLCGATVTFETAPGGRGLCVTVHFLAKRMGD